MGDKLKKISAPLFACSERTVYIFLIVYLCVACTALETDRTGSSQAGTNAEKEAIVPRETEPNHMSETPEAQPTKAVTADESGNNLPASITEEPIESITITSDVVIPTYKPLDVPFSEWEIHRSQELLEANGFGHTADEWRRATQHSSGLIRSTAYYLLTRQLDPQDEALFRQGLDDIDQTTQALSAYGLYRLGDKSVLPILERIAQLDVNVHTAATRAAGILGEIGEPTAFATIQKAINSDLDYIRLFAIQNAIPFAPLHGQPYNTSGTTIDIWDLYRQALQDESVQVRSVARLQLQELNSPEARELLQNHSKTSP
jgi:hypothetical protein